MRRYIILFLLFTVYMASGAELSDAYIDKYKSIAISEMHRTGIPASVKLAQGMLESNMGRSVLAVSANNHFGIKCGGHWQGKTFYRADDEKDNAGNLIESCFRSYDTDYQSYIGHSEFLNTKRYAFLFKLSRQDYKSWARGLSKAGYATDPKYSQKLIKIIEKYNLNQYDLDIKPIVKNTKSKSTRKPILVKTISDSKAIVDSDSKNSQYHHYTVLSDNRLKYITAIGDDQWENIAKSTNVNVTTLLKYNEIRNVKSKIYKGDKIYLTPKKRKYTGDKDWHKVAKNESLHDISQLYGVKKAKLRRLNRFPKNAIMVEGQKISLKKTVSKNSIPEFKLDDDRRRKSSKKKRCR